MNIRFGAKFSVWADAAFLKDTRTLLETTAQKQGIPIRMTDEWNTECLHVFTGPDADSFQGALERYHEYPSDNNKSELFEGYRFPADRNFWTLSRDFETTHANYVMTSGKPKFDLLTLKPLPADAPVDEQK